MIDFYQKSIPKSPFTDPVTYWQNGVFALYALQFWTAASQTNFPWTTFKNRPPPPNGSSKAQTGAVFEKFLAGGRGSIPVGNFKKSLNFKYFFCVSYNFAFMTDIQTQLFQKISKISQDLVIFTFSPSFVFQAKPHVFMRWDRRQRKIHQFDASHVHINPWEPAFF